MMDDDRLFKQRWKDEGPSLPKAPRDLSAKVWGRLKPRPRLRAWVWRPVLGALLLSVGYWLGQRQSAGQSEVRFRLSAPRASQVALSGSFNGWQPQPMHREGGDWVLDLRLKPGRHHYVFVLNGKRSLPDPEGGDAELNGSGEAQSVLYLPKTQAL
jgi:hypothetical protein